MIKKCTLLINTVYHTSYEDGIIRCINLLSIKVIIVVLFVEVEETVQIVNVKKFHINISWYLKLEIYNIEN